MSRQGQEQPINDVESTDSVSGPIQLPDEKATTVSRPLLPRSVPPHPRYQPYETSRVATQRSGVIIGEPSRSATSFVKEKIAELPWEVSEVTASLAQQTRQTSETVPQVQATVNVALHQANVAASGIAQLKA